MMRGARSKLYGFTLVELLIVVAIIGVLATIGVPTFRTMVQKAKKSEAKVGLGGLYTAETAFYSEYGTYGNMLDKIGFDLEGTSTSRIYSVGFLSSSCQSGNPSTSFPDNSTLQGSALNLAFPGYYSGTAFGVYPGLQAATGCISVLSINDFTAGAGGIIGNTSNMAQSDLWTMDRNRNLVNTQDGIVK